MQIMVAGGVRDPNLDSLQRAATRAGVEVISVRVRTDAPPAINLEWGTGQIEVDGRAHTPTAAFCRHDVFDFLTSGRAAAAENAYAWFCAVAGWCWAQPGITVFNRHAQFRANNKLAVLGEAVIMGLTVPVTRVTNDRRAALQESRDSIAKPVDGGGYCESLRQSLEAANWRDDRASAPAILQNRLVYPEYRVYVIDGSILAFRIHSESLDYRRDRAPRIELCRADSLGGATERLLSLAAALRVDFGAADFKTDPRSGLPVFLELNTSPMFAAFDSVADGGLADLMVAALVRIA
jgi:hypothetical protein